MVEFRVTDIHGNSNTCMVEVEVNDKVKPIFTCPPNKTIECHTELPPISDDLQANPGPGLVPVYQVLQIVNGFTTYTDDVLSDILGYYPVVDNCESAIYVRQSGGVNECKVGSFTRIFQAEDQSGNFSSTCVQVIAVVNSNPFNNPPSLADLNFNGFNCAPDREVNCTAPDEATHPDATGYPCINEDACDLVAMTWEDLDLPVIGSECRKILRTWTVIDWCQYNPATEAGIWTDLQIIKVFDNVDPVFEGETCNDGPTVHANSATCQGFVTLIGEASDICTDTEDLNWSYQIDRFNDGSYNLQGNTNNASGNFPIGTHKIKWTVEDHCGNWVSCEKLFYVIDDTPPYIDAITSTDINLVPTWPAGGQGLLWVGPLDLGTTDDCSNPVEIRVQKPSLGLGQTSPPITATTAPSIEFDCDDMPFTNIDYWARDNAGNWGYVIIQVVVEDNGGLACGNNTSAVVNGAIADEQNESVENVTVSVTGNASNMPADIVTGDDGAFEFTLPMHNNYTVTPERDDNPLNGVSTYDLVVISQHILGIQNLDSPYKMIAADVNKSGSITSYDMVELRKLILFINTEIPGNTSWRFVDADFVFPNAANPFATTFPEVTNYNDLDANQLADFVAVKVGDVNNSAIANSLQSSDTRNTVADLVFNIKDVDMKAGNEYTVEFKAKDFKAIAGYQFTMNFNQNAVEFVDVEAGALTGLNADNFGFALVNEGVITTSWNATDVASLNDNDVVFAMTFKAKSNIELSQAIKVSSRYTAAEAYNADADLMDVVFEFNGEVAGTDFALFQNQPNPFKGETIIGFELPEATTATLSIYDVSGRVLQSIEGEFAKGFNQVTINRSDLNGAGVLYYQLDTPTDSATKKMILVD